MMQVNLNNFKPIQTKQQINFGQVAQRQVLSSQHASIQLPKFGCENSDDKLLWFDSAKNGDFAKIEQLLEKGDMHPDLKDENGVTALMSAAKRGHIKTVQILLDAEADPNIIAMDGKNPFTALDLTQDDSVRELLKKAGGKLGMHPALRFIYNLPPA